MVNPDGGELNRRINVRSWDATVAEFPQLAGAPRAWYHSLTGDGIDQPGYDLNRDFNPDLDYTPRAADLPGKQTDAGFFLSPESRAIRDTYKAMRDEKGAVDAYIDLHHMGPCERITGGAQDGKLVTVTLDYPPLGVNDGAKYKKDWPKLDQDKSRRYAVTVRTASRMPSARSRGWPRRPVTSTPTPVSTRVRAAPPSRSMAPARCCSRYAVNRTTSARPRRACS